MLPPYGCLRGTNPALPGDLIIVFLGVKGKPKNCCFMILAWSSWRAWNKRSEHTQVRIRRDQEEAIYNELVALLQMTLLKEN